MYYLINETRTYYGAFINVSVSSEMDEEGRYSYNASFEWSTMSDILSINLDKLESIVLARR
ncbi:MAG: hypothetical protein ACFFD2_11575 [Promethearchaeota archaeon]